MPHVTLLGACVAWPSTLAAVVPPLLWPAELVLNGPGRSRNNPHQIRTLADGIHGHAGYADVHHDEGDA